MGMLPNRFQDNDEPPEYNTVDGTLWYFVSIYKYLQHTNDIRFVLDKILPVLKDNELLDYYKTLKQLYVDSGRRKAA